MLLFEIAAFLVGLLFGSFLNVCISRIPQHESPITGRSFCRSCASQIRWYDNIPLLSWIILRGRCRDCKARISWRYPAVELLTAFWFWKAFVAWIRLWFFDCDFCVRSNFRAEITLDQAGLLILGFLLIGLIVMDWQTQTLPDVFTLTGIAIAFLLTCTHTIFLGPTEDQITINGPSPIRAAGSAQDMGNVFLTGPEALILRWLAATIGAALILLIIRWLYKAVRHREGLALGDVKLLAMIAAFLGFWPAMLALFVGVLIATAYAIALLAARRANTLTKLPLGSFLGIGGLAASLFGRGIIDWYSSFLR